MKMTFRWYGTDDPVKLSYIRQIPGMTGVVSAIYDVPVGEEWPIDRIMALKQEVENAGLELEVIESVPVHEDIKLGSGNCERYIENYKKNIRNLSKAGVKVICYNFMPVFDWTRTQLDKKLADGSTALVYYQEQVDKIDVMSGEISLPGWDSSYKKEDLARLLDAYSKITAEDLWKNLGHFLEEIIPVAEECDVKMAIHPDDPPWPIFGLPRIIVDEASIDRFLKLVDSKYNGLTLCSGSLGCTSSNDIVKMVRKYSGMGRIHFAHIRNVKILENSSFEEAAHLSSCGSLDVYEIMKAYYDTGFEGYVRPDHGRMIWGEQGRPGYGLFDRALGAVYMNGLWEAIDKAAKNQK